MCLDNANNVSRFSGQYVTREKREHNDYDRFQKLHYQTGGRTPAFRGRHRGLWGVVDWRRHVDGRDRSHYLMNGHIDGLLESIRPVAESAADVLAHWWRAS